MGNSKRGIFWISLFLALTAALGYAAWALGCRPFGGGRPLGHGAAPPPGALDADGTPDAAGVSPITCVVIDAGHGGEDGGTSSAAGLVEKDVNLAVAEALRGLLETAGVRVIMTRTEDKLLYDRGVDYQGRKKVLDLAARRTVAETTEGCLFVSIHMNAFPDPRYSGMQVWYSPHDPRSAAIAEDIQAGAQIIMPENNRKIKAAGRNIYLLDRLETPAVLVECGFLSSPAEAERLDDPAYRRALSAVIFAGIMPYIET